MLIQSVFHLAFGKDDVPCLDMPARHTRPAVELRHLRYFVAVAEMENVSRAALKLHVSQPALSRQIRDLEDEIGFSLLERTAKSLRLTDAGRAFLDTCVGGYAVEILRGTVVLCVAPPNAALKSLLVQLNCY